MAKMKKALGSLALIIALAMIIGMLPTVVLASNTTAITTQADACYDEEEGIVTVEGTISSNEADVTILAVRSAEEITNATSYFEEIGDDIESKIVYIDQVGAEDVDNYEATEDGANWNFTFVPKEGVSGGWITVFVGGTDASIDLVSFSAQVPAPTLAAQTWYMGEDLVMDITYTDAEAIAAWEAVIESVLVNGDTFVDYDIDEDEATITFTGLSEAVTSIEITTVDGEYAAIEMTGLNIATQPKAAGTVAPASATVVENDTASVAFDVTESAQGGWLAEFGAEGSAVVKVDTVETDDWSYVAGDEGEGVLTINGLTVGADDEKMFSVVVEATNYAASTAATVTVKSPVKDAYDNFASISVDYSDSIAVDGAPTEVEGDDYWDLWGAASVTLPSTGANETTITWVDGEGEAASGTVDLERPAEDASEAYVEYTFTATITKGAFTAKEKPVTVRVNKAGTATAIEAEMITFIKDRAYGIDGYSLITVDAGDAVDGTTQTITIGEDTLYYSTVKGIFIGVISTPAEIGVEADEEGYAAAFAAAVAEEEITISGDPSDTIIFGKCTEYGDGLTPADWGQCRRVSAGLDTYANEDVTIKQLIAMDVFGGASDGIINAADWGAIRRVTANIDDDLAINAVETE